MAKTPSLSIADAESLIGERPISVNSENRGLVRKWMTAHGLPSLYVVNLCNADLEAAYNDSAALDTLRDRASTWKTANGAADYSQTTKLRQEAAALDSTIIGRREVATDAKTRAVDALAALLDSSSVKLDESDVRRIVQEEIAGKLSIQRLEIKGRGGNITAVEGHLHPMFPTLARMAISFGNDGFVPGIFISGEASSGKTHGCKMLAKALGLPWHFNGAISQPHEMLGFIDAGGRYHSTPFREAYEHGGVYTFDEVDRSDPVALLAVNPHLANGVAQFPDRQIVRHPNCIIVATANTWGTGADAKYSGATKLDAAFLSRFPQRIRWNIDLDLERAITKNDSWCARVQNARRKAQAAGLQVMIDVRMTLAGAAMIAGGGMSENEAAEYTYLANLSDDQRRLVS